MDFVFQGFQSALPSWLYLLFIIIAGGLAWWAYKDIKTINSFYRFTLIFLRGITFLILLILLLNPFFKSESIRFERPELLVMFDNSSSVSVNKGDYEGGDTYRQLLSDLNFSGIDRFNFRYFSFDSDIASSHPDSLTLDGSETNLFKAAEVIRNNEQDARAALLFSDGIFNQGQNPIYLSRELRVPVFTIALGDTSRLRDLIVQNIVTNATGYLNSSHAVEATILNRGFGGETFEVQLKSGNEVLQTQTFQAGSSASSHTVTFEIELQEEGLQQFEITVPAKEDEWTEANNTQPFSVEVLDDRQSILSLAFEIHPDVSMMRSLLLQDENTQLSTRTWLGGNRFISGNLSLDPDTLDLVLLHGYPSGGVPGELSTRIGNLLQTVPAIIAATPNSSFRNLEDEGSILLPGTQTASASPLEVSLSPAVESTEHPVMELPEVSYDRLPSVYAPIRGVTIAAGSTILFSSIYQGNATEEPVVVVNETGNLRRSQLNGFGWYRIAQSTNPQARKFIESLIYNLVSWTAAKPDNRRLKIQPTQKVFTGSESVSFNAFLTNESGEVESEGTISVTISGENMDPRLYNMNNIGGGQYRLDIGSLPEGIYNFEATAEKGNRTIDTQIGEFSVSRSNVEYVNTIRDDALIQQIANVTGGQFYTYENAGTVWQDMDDRGLLAREENVHTELFYPYQHAFWFILAIVLLACEWFLRKYIALP